MASNAIIQCTSSSSHMMRTYDVFVSFRGEDTRNNFTGFLFQDLSRNGIEAFKDDTHLKKGESIAPELLQAIQGSRIFVVVFSKKYASSTWCLRELAQILNCIETSPRRVLPIFYDVNPSEVRKQSGDYERAFAEYQKRFGEDKEKMEEVQRWREALKHVGGLCGWHIGNKSQYAEIELIVQDIINILGPKFSSLPNDDLVGMQSRVKKLTKLLHLGSVNDVRVVGISGMSGIGKSTLARALYERISGQYDFHCFIDDVSKIYRDSSTLGVQKQLLSQCLNEKNLEICNVSNGTSLVWTKLHNARALIVLDNVDQVEQLKMFIGRETLLSECVGGGSKIIIISRNEHILKAHGVDDVYQVLPLDHKDAVQLSCRIAFKGDYIKSDYEEFTKVIVSHAEGHPLALKVAGSSLSNRSVPYWRSAVAKLIECKSEDIMNVLQIGFDGLNNLAQKIFLDIACFFNGYDEQHVKEVLDFRGFHPECGLEDLINNSIITIICGKIYMHSLLKDLGRFIVREKSLEEPRNWSRLWEYQYLHKVMSNIMEAKTLEAIVLEDDIWTYDKTTMKADAFSEMKNLKLLQLRNVNFSGRLSYLSNELGYLTWKRYPFECLPESFQPDKLVELSLSKSNIKQLWEDKKPLPNLRRVDLSDSENLIKVPELGNALNLEWLNLEGCINLIELPRFKEAINLETLNLEGCIKLKQIDQSIGLLKKLTFLNLKDCRNLIVLPDFREDLNLETLDLEGCTQLRQINSSIGLLRKLNFLNLEDCKSLVSLPNSILDLTSLEYLSLSGCSKLQLLDEPRDAEHSKRLCIGEAPHRSHSTWSFMERFLKWLSYSMNSRKDSISCLLPSSSTFPCMRELDLSFCNLVQIPDVIGELSCLERLNLSGNNFARLPNLKELSKLYSLDLQHCKQLKNLPELPSRTDFRSKAYTPPWPSVEWVFAILQSPIMKPPRVIIHAGLNIFNCPELVEREHCTSKSFSWMMEILQAQCFPAFYTQEMPRVSSIIPGSEIPRWFKNQHLGMDSLASPPKPDDDCVAVVCCVVFRVRRGRGLVSKTTGRYYGMVFPLLVDEDLVADTSDHMWLVCGSSRVFPRFLGSMLQYDIEMMAIVGGFDVEVKKYGYHPIYKEDLELSNLAMTDSGNSSARKRKFLAIEENK